MEGTMTERRKERDRARRKRRKARGPTNAAEKRGTAASTSWWKRGAATTRSSMRKTVRIGRHEGGYSFGHNLTRCTKASESEAERSLVDVARADTIDAELDRLICKRASQDRRPDPDEQEEAWKSSVRAYTARRQEENRLAWCDYFGRLSASVRSPRTEEYDHGAQALLEDRGRVSADGRMPRN
jgi:hypothetical protein